MSGELEHLRLVPPARPRWDRDGGLWYPSSFIPKNGPQQMVRFWPTINAICEPLMGSSKAYPVNGGTKYHVTYPSKERCFGIYREAVELIKSRRVREDLFILSIYRRQVTEEGDIWLDELFFELAETFALTPEEWGVLALRMPRCSRIRRLCLKRAHLPREVPLPLAAE